MSGTPDDDILRGLGTVDEADLKLEALRERLARRLREEAAASAAGARNGADVAARDQSPIDAELPSHKALVATQARTIARLTRVIWVLVIVSAVLAGAAIAGLGRA